MGEVIMKKGIYLFFVSLFLILLIFILLSVFSYSIISKNIYNLFLIIILTIFFMFILKQNKIKLNIKKHNSKYIILIIFVSGLILRLLLLLNEYSYPQNDYERFYISAIAISNNISNLDSKYISIFPHIGGYILFLGKIFKIFGTNYNVYIILNIMFDLMGGFFVFKTLKILSSKKTGVIGLIIYMFNPINILACSLCSPIIIFNSLLSIVFYITSLIIKNNINDKQKFLLLNILLGIVIGITNIFRPIMPIYIISMSIYYIYLFLINKNTKILTYIFALILLIIPYHYITKVNEIMIYKTINLELTNNSIGWNLYIGSNIQNRGMWSEQTGKNFTVKYNDNNMDANQIQNYFMKLGINQYKNNGFNNLKLLGLKFNVFHERLGSYVYNSYFDSLSVQNNNTVKLLVILITNIVYYSFIILPILNFKSICNPTNSKYLVYIVFFIGIVISHLIMEASPRYMFPLINIYILASSICLSKIIIIK